MGGPGQSKGRIMIFDSRIAGIPCQIEITHYAPPERGFITCMSSEPLDPGELEWIVLDRRGREADWLADKLTKADRQRIDDEAVDFIQQEKAEAAISAAEYRMEYYR